MPPSTSTRWSPTPEQLMILEEMYKSGLRTPNAPQIQKITAHLSYYGKIEGKNVFYWFQNHKARDRQKLRRKLSKQQPLQEQMLSYNQNHHGQSYNNFKLFGSIHHPMISHQPSHDKSSAESPHQGGADGALPNYKRKLDNPDIHKVQDMMSKSHTDDWMMMMLREACDTRPCCSNNNRPLKTLQLFPIKGPSLKQDQEQLRHCHTTNFSPKYVSSSLMPFDLGVLDLKSSM